MAQPSSVDLAISPASRHLYRELHSYLYKVEDPSLRSHSSIVTDNTYQSAESPSPSSSLHPPAPPVVDDLGQTRSSPYLLSNPQPFASPEMDSLDQKSNPAYSSPYSINGDRNSPFNNTHAASNASLRRGDCQPHHNFMLPRASPNAPLPSIEQAIYGSQTKWTEHAKDRPLYGRNPVCDDACDKCRPGCPNECINHCGPRTHLYHFRPGQKLAKIITIFLSPFEVMPSGFLCQNPHCSLAVHHAAGYYTFDRGQRGGTVSLAPPDILDAMERMERGEGGQEERILVGWFRYVHEGCDYAIKVEREEYEGEDVEGRMLSTLNGRRALDGMFGDERFLDEYERIG